MTREEFIKQTQARGINGEAFAEGFEIAGIAPWTTLGIPITATYEGDEPKPLSPTLRQECLGVLRTVGWTGPGVVLEEIENLIARLEAEPCRFCKGVGQAIGADSVDPKTRTLTNARLENCMVCEGSGIDPSEEVEPAKPVPQSCDACGNELNEAPVPACICKTCRERLSDARVEIGQLKRDYEALSGERNDAENMLIEAKMELTKTRQALKIIDPWNTATMANEARAECERQKTRALCLEDELRSANTQVARLKEAMRAGTEAVRFTSFMEGRDAARTYLMRKLRSSTEMGLSGYGVRKGLEAACRELLELQPQLEPEK